MVPKGTVFVVANPSNLVHSIISKHSPREIVRRLVPKKNQNNMADSSEKVSFRVDMQCSSLRAEAFLVAEDFRKIGKRQLADSWPTVGRLSADCFLGELFFIFSESTMSTVNVTEVCATTSAINQIHVPRGLKFAIGSSDFVSRC